MDIRFDNALQGTQGRGENTPAFALGSRLLGKVLAVDGQNVRLQCGDSILEAKTLLPLALGDRLLLTVTAKDASGMVLKLTPQSEPVLGTLTDDDLGAILNDWNLPKGGVVMKAAQSLVMRRGMLDQLELRDLLGQLNRAESEDVETASFLFAKGLPISADSLEWAKEKEGFFLRGLAEKVDTLIKPSDPEGRKGLRVLQALIERFRSASKDGAGSLLEVLRSPESVALRSLEGDGPPLRLEENATAQLQVLADRNDPLGMLASELLGALRFFQLAGTVRPEVPFLLEGGEGRIETEGERLAFEMDFDMLGRIRVEMLQHEGRLGLQVLADDAGTAAWLSEKIDSLRSKLEEKGYSPFLSLRRKQLVSQAPSSGRIDLRL